MKFNTNFDDHLDLHSDIISCFEPHPQKSSLLRKAIFEGTLKSLAKEGLDRISYQSIARAAKMHPSHIVYYYPQKKLLIEKAVMFSILALRERGKKMKKKKPSAMSAKEHLTLLINRDFDHYEKLKNRYGLFIETYLCGFSKPYSAFYRSYRNRGAGAVAEIIQDHLEARGYTRHQIWQRALDIQMLITGYLIDYCSLQLVEKRDDYRAYSIEATLRLAEIT